MSVEPKPLTQPVLRWARRTTWLPSRLSGPAKSDHRADIFSLGVVFYEMLTGELPLGRFSAPSHKAKVDPRIDEIVFQALAKEKELRQRNAHEFNTSRNDRKPANDSKGFTGSPEKYSSLLQMFCTNARDWLLALFHLLCVLGTGCSRNHSVPGYSLMLWVASWEQLRSLGSVCIWGRPDHASDDTHDAGKHDQRELVDRDAYLLICVGLFLVESKILAYLSDQLETQCFSSSRSSLQV